MKNAETHFDEIAREYDFWKNKNGYYYRNLIALYRSLIPSQSSVLEIGCGTGDILVQLEPREGKGIDLSHEMIVIAQKKHADQKHITFAREDIFDANTSYPAEVIFLAGEFFHFFEGVRKNESSTQN